MKYAFIINPVSGKGRGADELIRAIEERKAEGVRDLRYYLTRGEEDAAVLADALAREAAAQGEEIRIYAAGGDGTLHVVANGLYGHDNACLGLLPIGSGNDFARIFPAYEEGSLLDIEAQLEAPERPVDVLRYRYERAGERVSCIGINGINIGFDGNTAILAHRLRERSFFAGTPSYLAALGINLIRKAGQRLRVSADGEEIYKGFLLLCTVSNGRYCGGGVESCPLGEPDDGWAELLVVRNIARRDLVRMFPMYRDGRLFELPDFEKIAHYRRARQVHIEPLTGHMQFVVDGEILETGALEVNLEPHALRLLVPESKQISAGRA